VTGTPVVYGAKVQIDLLSHRSQLLPKALDNNQRGAKSKDDADTAITILRHPEQELSKC